MIGGSGGEAERGILPKIIESEVEQSKRVLLKEKSGGKPAFLT